jgi:hypothetical protein
VQFQKFTCFQSSLPIRSGTDISTIPPTRLITIAIAIYLVWILATYLLEGRIHLLQKPDRLGRLIYALIANMIIGTAIAIWLLKPFILNRFVNPKQLGFQSPVNRVIVAIVIAGLIGFALFIIQKPTSLNPY